MSLLMAPTDDPNVFINTQTNKKVAKGSRAYRSLLLHDKQVAAEAAAETPVTAADVTNKARTVLKTLADENRKALDVSRDPEADLRKLLYDKLCVASKPVNIPKAKQKNRYSYYIDTDDEQTESDESD